MRRSNCEIGDGEFGDAFAGVLHEREAGDAVALGGEAVDLAHFRGCENFHGFRNYTGCAGGRGWSARGGGAPA